jgi:hypothetical protein
VKYALKKVFDNAERSKRDSRIIKNIAKVQIDSPDFSPIEGISQKINYKKSKTTIPKY